MKITRRQLKSIIKEVIDPKDGKIKMYHTFGKSRNIKIINGQPDYDILPKEELVNRVKSIMKNGFIPSDNHLFGKGIYGFKPSQFKSLAGSQSALYGNYALEFEIKDISRWLILDSKEAKKVKGSNAPLRKQLELLGVDLDRIFIKRHIDYVKDEETNMWVEQKPRALTIGDFMDLIEEWEKTGRSFADNDTYQEYIQIFAGDFPYYNIDGMLLNENWSNGNFYLGFFVCTNLNAVTLTGYCEDIATGVIKPLPNISMT